MNGAAAVSNDTVWSTARLQGYRLYVEEGLAVRRKRRKRLVRERAIEPRLTGANQEWAMDFIVDRLATGRMVRILSVVDAYTRECLALVADTSLGSGRVTRVLEGLIAELSTWPFCMGRPGWMWTSLTFQPSAQASMRREVNSGPLSERTLSGRPCASTAGCATSA